MAERAHGGRGIMGPALGETATPFLWNRTQDRFPRTAREITMRRREFIAGLGSTVACPAAARSQTPAVPVVGYIGSIGRDHSCGCYVPLA